MASDSTVARIKGDLPRERNEMSRSASPRLRMKTKKELTNACYMFTIVTRMHSRHRISINAVFKFKFY